MSTNQRGAEHSRDGGGHLESVGQSQVLLQRISLYIGVMQRVPLGDGQTEAAESAGVRGVDAGSRDTVREWGKEYGVDAVAMDRAYRNRTGQQLWLFADRKLGKLFFHTVQSRILQAV
jgi:hypothetical protein